MASNFEISVSKFLREYFESLPSYNSLTKTELRNLYIEQHELPELDKKERKLFSSIVNVVIIEFADRIRKNKIDNSPTKSTKHDAPTTGSSDKKVSAPPLKKANLKSDVESDDSNAFVIDEEQSEKSENEDVKGQQDKPLSTTEAEQNCSEDEDNEKASSGVESSSEDNTSKHYNSSASDMETKGNTSDSSVAQDLPHEKETGITKSNSKKLNNSLEEDNEKPQKDDSENPEKESSDSAVDSSDDDVVFEKNAKAENAPKLNSTISDMETKENSSDVETSDGHDSSDKKEAVVAKSNVKKRKRSSEDKEKPQKKQKQSSKKASRRGYSGDNSSSDEDEGPERKRKVPVSKKAQTSKLVDKDLRKSEMSSSEEEEEWKIQKKAAVKQKPNSTTVTKKQTNVSESVSMNDSSSNHDEDEKPKKSKSVASKKAKIDEDLSKAHASRESCTSDEKENSVLKANLKKPQKTAEKEKLKKKQSSKKALNSNSSSDDSPKEDKISKKKDKPTVLRKKASKAEISSSEEEDNSAKSSGPSEEEEELGHSKNKNAEKKKAKSDGAANKKKVSNVNARIEHLKKYIRVSGVRIQKYETLFKTCKSMKAKADKLIEVLENAGVKGRPTLEKCRKVKKKMERKKELESLNMENIIETEGRPKRNSRSLYASSPCPVAEKVVETSASTDFSNLKDIIDSGGESDTPAVKVTSRMNRIIMDSDDSC